jgi:hypothetical protein
MLRAVAESCVLHTSSPHLYHITPTYHNQAPCTTALAHAPSHLTERETHAHPLHPAAFASVSYGKVLDRVHICPEAASLTPNQPGKPSKTSPARNTAIQFEVHAALGRTMWEPARALVNQPRPARGGAQKQGTRMKLDANGECKFGQGTSEGSYMTGGTVSAARLTGQNAANSRRLAPQHCFVCHLGLR